MNTASSSTPRVSTARHRDASGPRRVIRKAEDATSSSAMARCARLAHSGVAHKMEDARARHGRDRPTCVIRPGFTLGGRAAGLAYNVDEFEDTRSARPGVLMNSDVLGEESLDGVEES